MRSGRLAPVDDDYRTSNAGDTPASTEAPPPLTHRPRSLARLTSKAIKSATGRIANPSEGDDQGARPRATAATALETRPTDLRPFADQLIAIAHRLRSAEFGDGPTPHALTPAQDNADGPAPRSAAPSLRNAQDIPRLDAEQRRKAFAEMARVSYAKRRKRVAIFGDPELFGEPAWDILLDLYIAQAEDKTVSVSSACIGSAAPPTTGLRWLGVLADQGLLEREHDPQDQRRVLVRLTDKALEAMDGYFTASAGLQADRRNSRA